MCRSKTPAIPPMQRKTAVQCVRDTHRPVSKPAGVTVWCWWWWAGVRSGVNLRALSLNFASPRRVGSIIRSRSSALTSARGTINQAGRRTELHCALPTHIWFAQGEPPLTPIWRILLLHCPRTGAEERTEDTHMVCSRESRL